MYSCNIFLLASVSLLMPFNVFMYYITTNSILFLLDHFIICKFDFFFSLKLDTF